jgi:heme-degrading monooxygenase HmoA
MKGHYAVARMAWWSRRHHEREMYVTDADTAAPTRDAEAPQAPAEPMQVSSVVRINAISVPPGAGPELERRFAQRAGAVEGSPGFLGFQLLRPTAGGDRYFVVTHWADEESFVAWRDGQGVAAHAGQRSAPVSTGAELLEFDVILDVHPAG